MADTTVLIVGGGFAGVTCAQHLAKHNVDVILLDQNNYHQFQPMLYQVATAQVAAYDIARPLRGIFHRDKTVDLRRTAAASIDPTTRSVTTASGSVLSGEYLVMAAGAQANFFGTPGAAEHALPLYSVNDAERLRAHILDVLDATVDRPKLVDRGSLNFVIVGGGPTGVETAGALAEVLRDVVPDRYRSLAAPAKVHLVDLGDVLLAPFSDKAHTYAAKRLERDGVTLHLGVGVKEVLQDRVTLTDGTEIITRTVIWGGGEKPADVIATAGLPTGRGGRIDVQRDLTVAGHPRVYVLGDAANVPGADGVILAQLGSVAQQSGAWAARNILDSIAGKPGRAFRYKDKGIMAMIGRNAAVAEMGPHRHEVEGPVAFAAWLGVHAMLLSGIRSKIDAFIAWGWDYFSKNRATAVVDGPDAARIEWGDDDHGERPEFEPHPAGS
ncbi:NADH dehydrogenase [Kibdelosporangium banguiense]|uniref:NADH dehydrogenase n=1 Tax=Kibdelosporangium banguiense TaxID=1365924 RepID=A0ABS4TWA7_9PSEU|nr:NAD(P)/FAD-dependent oxidoreductase [Kibdelosporangium banguiense]MBP2328696.1 NADH dehydrogenase [Kibdelosporangium banguiense]